MFCKYNLQITLYFSKVEVKLKKRDGIWWEKLEGDVENRPMPAPLMPAPSSVSDQPSGPPKYPSSSKKAKDWDKIVIDDDKEDGVDQLFQKIYSEGSDEIKKAMNKSFVSSNFSNGSYPGLHTKTRIT
jgi:suppressor of G2 allele of SKP1